MIKFDQATGLPTVVVHPYIKGGVRVVAETRFVEWRYLNGSYTLVRQMTSVAGEVSQTSRLISIRTNVGLRLSDLRSIQ